MQRRRSAEAARFTWYWSTQTFAALKIISGGQTGADRAALDWAIARGVEHGGWCPAGRKAEDGPLDPIYNLSETSSGNYRRRTVRNVRDSDATLIVNVGELDGGSLETLRIAHRENKPARVVALDQVLDDSVIEELRAWAQAFDTLNVAGPRESKRPGIYRATRDFLQRLFR